MKNGEEIERQIEKKIKKKKKDRKNRKMKGVTNGQNMLDIVNIAPIYNIRRC